MTQLKIGDKAPDFTLKDQNGKEFNLSSYRGKKILLSFHPLHGLPFVQNKCRHWKNILKIFKN